MSEEENAISDEEQEEEEVEEEAEATEAPAAAADAAADDDEEEQEAEEEEKPRQRAPPPAPKEVDEATLTEAEQAMLAQKRRHEEEQAAKMQDSEEKRKAELQQVEAELEELKERQIERRKQREVEEQEFAERHRAEEARRRAEEAERKTKLDAERQRRSEDKARRQNQMAGAFAGITAGAGEGKNFVIPEKGGGGGERPGHLTQSNAGGRKALTAAQKEDNKKNYMAIANRPIEVSTLLPNDIKTHIQKLHAKIVKLEGDKYDLEAREQRLDYDLRELDERQKQATRAKAKASGQEVEEGAGNMPPRINVASKHDRQVDRRSWQERRELYEKPYVKPQPSIAHGTARPPPEWGRKELEELENIRKNFEGFKYEEIVRAEGDAARPPVEPIPLQMPTEDAEPDVPQTKLRIFQPDGEEQESRAAKWANNRAYSVSEIIASGGGGGDYGATLN